MFLSEIRKLKDITTFGQFLEEALRDKFVFQDGEFEYIKQLLAENNLTLAKAISLALSFETTLHENQIMVKKETENIYQIQTPRRCK